MKESRFLAMFCLAVAMVFAMHPAATATSAPPRIAILAAHPSNDVRAVAELLTVRLGGSEVVSLVERADLDRVLAEHHLQAAYGQLPQETVMLGKLLRADGFVFVGRNDKNNILTVRLTEARRGFQAHRTSLPAKNGDPAEQVEAIARDLLAALPKLRLDPSERLPVSIIRIGNATLRSDYFWIEEAYPQLLADYLSRDPHVMVLERRQLLKLRDEAFFADGDEAGLLASCVVIDGDVGVSRGATLGNDDVPLSFVVRFRSPAEEELGRIDVAGTISNLDQIAQETAQAALAELHRLGPQTAGSAIEEAAIFRRLGTAWANAAAYALDPETEVNVAAVVEDLADWRIRDGETRLEAAQRLHRAAQLCLASDSKAARYELAYPGGIFRGHEATLLNDFESILDPTVNSLLEPVRQVVRLGMEEREIEDGEVGSALLQRCGQFFANPLDCQTYIRGLLDRYLSMAETNVQALAVASHIIVHNEALTPRFYEPLTKHSSAAIRFCALIRLLGFTQEEKPRARLAAVLLDTLEPFLDVPRVMAHISSFVHHQYMLDPINSALELHPDRKQYVGNVLHAAFLRMVDAGEFKTLLAISPKRYMDKFTPEMQYTFTSRLLEKIPRDPPPVRASIFRYQVQPLETLHRELLAELGRTEDVDGNPLTVRELISARSPRWQNLAGHLYDMPTAPQAVVNEKNHGLTPQRLWIEDGSCWVGLRSRISLGFSKDTICQVGLLHLDLQTGRILSFRHESATLAPEEGELLPRIVVWDKTRSELRAHLTNLHPFGSFMCVGLDEVGVLLFPMDDRDARGGAVHCIDRSFGLPDLYFSGLATTDEHLVIGLTDAIVRWKPGSQHVEFVCDVGRQTSAGPLGDCRRRLGPMLPGPGNHVDCIIAGSPGSRTIEAWRLNVDDGHWLKLAACQSLDRGLGVASVTHSNSIVLRTYQGAKHLDCIAPGVVYRNGSFESSELTKNIWPTLAPSIRDQFESARYRDVTLVLAGFGTDWRLLALQPEESQNTDLSWAPVATGTAREADRNTVSEPPKEQLPTSVSGRAADTALLRAAHAGDLSGITQHLAAGANIETRAMKTGRTPLAVAASRGHIEAVKLLHRRGAAIEARSTSSRQTVLMEAVQSASTETVEYLIAQGADIHARLPNGATVICSAAYAGQTENVRLLLDAGVKLNTPNSWDRALLNAVIQQQTETALFLLERGAKPRLGDPDSTQNIPLLVQAMFKPQSPELIRALVGAGAEVNAPSVYGHPLRWAHYLSLAGNVSALIDVGFATLTDTEIRAWLCECDFAAFRPSRLEADILVREAFGRYLARREGGRSITK